MSDADSNLNLLRRLRAMNSEQATEFLDKTLLNSNHMFMSNVLEEIQKVDSQKSANLIKKLVSNYSGILLISLPTSVALMNSKGFNPDSIKYFLKDEDFLIRITGFLTILQTYSCLTFLQKKYNIEDQKFDLFFESIKKNSLELLPILEKDKDESLRIMSSILIKEISFPSENVNQKFSDKMFNNIAGRTLKLVPSSVLINHAASTDSGENAKNFYLMMFIALMPLTNIDPKKIFSVGKVCDENNDLTNLLISYYCNTFRKSPDDILDIIKKLLHTADPLGAIYGLYWSFIPLITLPEKTIQVYEQLFTNSIYEDKELRIALIFLFSYLKKLMTFIEDYVPENDSEILIINNRVQKDIEYLLDDKNNEVRMYADIVLNGIEFLE